eukprot:gb/GEZN01001812.1/.p1 GENE.gb/GEZN01001812.1/~~gb/GEZN01001812.1/.p1  ORF type:complete len:772 (-),score=95.84 gb/GEZN01001812.1/:287-2602(-)
MRRRCPSKRPLPTRVETAWLLAWKHALPNTSEQTCVSSSSSSSCSSCSSCSISSHPHLATTTPIFDSDDSLSESVPNLFSHPVPCAVLQKHRKTSPAELPNSNYVVSFDTTPAFELVKLRPRNKDKDRLVVNLIPTESPESSPPGMSRLLPSTATAAAAANALNAPTSSSPTAFRSPRPSSRALSANSPTPLLRALGRPNGLYLPGSPQRVSHSQGHEASLVRGGVSVSPFMSVRQLKVAAETTPEENPLDAYDIKCKLGEGSYGSVYLAVRKADDKAMALKCVEAGTAEAMASAQREITFMHECKSSGVVECYGSFFWQGMRWIAMEHCDAGSFKDVMEICDITLSEREIAVVMLGALRALANLHRHKKIHRDVKAANLLLTHQGEVKLADFGVCCDVTFRNRRSTMVGTPYWMAPEFLQGDDTSYDAKVDVWALGITAIELATGQPPLLELHPIKAMDIILRDAAPSLPNETGEFSADFSAFVAQCLQKDPFRRPSASDLLSSSFIRKVRGRDCGQDGSIEVLRGLYDRHAAEIAEYRLTDAKMALASDDEFGNFGGHDIDSHQPGDTIDLISAAFGGADTPQVTRNTAIPLRRTKHQLAQPLSPHSMEEAFILIQGGSGGGETFTGQGLGTFTPGAFLNRSPSKGLELIGSPSSAISRGTFNTKDEESLRIFADEKAQQPSLASSFTYSAKEAQQPSFGSSLASVLLRSGPRRTGSLVQVASALPGSPARSSRVLGVSRSPHGSSLALGISGSPRVPSRAKRHDNPNL